MSNSVLQSVKKKLGLTADYQYFDEDQLYDYINLAFSELHQLGAGPVAGYYIDDPLDDWNGFTQDIPLQNLVKSYVYIRVRILFDPPTSSFVLDSLNKQLEELVWRINVYVDPSNTFTAT